MYFFCRFWLIWCFLQLLPVIWEGFSIKRDSRDGVLRISNALISEAVESECKTLMKQELSNHDLTNFDLRVYMNMLRLSDQYSYHIDIVPELISLGFHTECTKGHNFPIVYAYYNDTDEILVKRVLGDKAGRSSVNESIQKLIDKKYLIKLDDKILIPVYTGYTEVPITALQVVTDYHLNNGKSRRNSGLNYSVLLMCCLFRQFAMSKSTKCYLGNECSYGTEFEMFSARRKLFSDAKNWFGLVKIEKKVTKKSFDGKFYVEVDFILRDKYLPTFDEVKLSEEDEKGFWSRNATCDINTKMGKMVYTRFKLKCLLRDGIEFADKDDIDEQIAEYDREMLRKLEEEKKRLREEEEKENKVINYELFATKNALGY